MAGGPHQWQEDAQSVISENDHCRYFHHFYEERFKRGSCLIILIVTISVCIWHEAQRRLDFLSEVFVRSDATNVRELYRIELRFRGKLFCRDLYKVSFPCPNNRQVTHYPSGCRGKRRPLGEIFSPVRVVAFPPYITVLLKCNTCT